MLRPGAEYSQSHCTTFRDARSVKETAMSRSCWRLTDAAKRREVYGTPSIAVSREEESCFYSLGRSCHSGIPDLQRSVNAYGENFFPSAFSREVIWDVVDSEP